MTSGFWAGAIPPWAYVVGALAWIVALLVGMWVGFGRGQAEAEEELGWAREQAKARHTHPVYRAPELAHEVWPYEDAQAAYEEYAAQALTLANGQVWNPPEAALANGPVLEPTAVYGPEDSSVTAWTARQAAKMDAFLRDLFEVTDERMREITR